MACKCKVNQQIDYLHKKYGDNIPQSKKTNISGNIMAHAENIFISILLLPLIPFMLIYALYKMAIGKPIHMDKVFKKA